MSDDNLAERNLVHRIMKSDLEQIYRNTHKQMLERHPNEKKMIDKMLEVKLKTIGVKP